MLLTLAVLAPVPRDLVDKLVNRTWFAFVGGLGQGEPGIASTGPTRRPNLVDQRSGASTRRSGSPGASRSARSAAKPSVACRARS